MQLKVVKALQCEHGGLIEAHGFFLGEAFTIMFMDDGVQVNFGGFVAAFEGEGTKVVMGTGHWFGYIIEAKTMKEMI